jgi:hypothetical protein
MLDAAAMTQLVLLVLPIPLLGAGYPGAAAVLPAVNSRSALQSQERRARRLPPQPHSEHPCGDALRSGRGCCLLVASSHDC